MVKTKNNVKHEMARYLMFFPLIWGEKKDMYFIYAI